MNAKLRLFWLGLFLLVSSWQFLLPVFTPPAWIGLPLVFLGALVIGLSFASDAVPVLSRGGLLCYAIAAVAVAALAPYPYRLGGLLLLGGTTCMWGRRPGSKSYRFGFGLLLTGIIFVLQSFCLPVLMSIGSVFHRLAFIAPVICVLFRFFGYSADCEGSTIYVQTDRGIQEFAVSAEYFGWLFLFNAALGVVVWQTLGRFKHRFRNSLGFFVAALVYALGRCLLLAVLYLNLHAFSVFWNPWVFCLSFLPLFLWLSRFWWKPESLPESLPPVARWPSSRTQALAAAAVALAMGLLVAAWAWEDPGQPKSSRMLIDEAHSDWEQMNRKYDTEWYGEESGYNYYCLADLLGRYYHVRKGNTRITPAILADCDILVLKTPTRSFTPDEIDAIEAFVARGGGLLLIGDHTNVFGTSTYLNPIARRFGLHYNYDATYDLPTGGLSLFEKPRLLPHPIVQWLPPFLFGTSCTLQVPWGAALPMNGYALRVAGHDYSSTSFFTSKTDGPQIGFGLFPQLAAVKFKRGRVVAFTDSTVFSNFWIFIPGKPELLLGCTNWLNRQNPHPHRSAVLVVLSLALATAAGFSLRGRLAPQFPFVFAAASLGFLSSAYLIGAANRFAYRPPAPHTLCRSIGFDRQYSHFELPSDTLFHAPNVDFHTFYVWVQRLGYEPRVCPKLDQALASTDGLVMLNPSGPVAARSLLSVQEYVRQGGLLYLFDSPTNRVSAANQILSRFGVALINGSLESQSIFDEAGKLVASNRFTGITRGGQGLLFTAGRQPVLSIKREGKGAVIFSGDAELFANSSLGTTGTVPDESRKRLYGVIFSLFRQIETQPRSSTAVKIAQP